MNWEKINLKGKTIKSLDIVEYEEINFSMTDGTKYKMYHEQDCCENVIIDFDNSSNIKDFEGKTIITYTEESAEYNEASDSGTITTYTFYFKDGTNGKIVWIGESNGYYSETPSLRKVKE